MIFKVTFSDGRIDYCTAKNQFHLTGSYNDEFGFSINDFTKIEEISEEQSKTIKVEFSDFEDNDASIAEIISLHELVYGDLVYSDDFNIICSNESQD